MRGWWWLGRAEDLAERAAFREPNTCILGGEKDRVFSACFDPVSLAAILRISAVPR